MKYVFLILFCLGGAVSPALAGPFGDEMTKCLVTRTSPQDQTVMLKWIFGAMSQHPDVRAMSGVTLEQATALNEDMSKMISKLMTETCKAETVNAFKYEGYESVTDGFGMLGQVAMQNLMGHPDVIVFLSELNALSDSAKIEEVLGTELK